MLRLSSFVLLIRPLVPLGQKMTALDRSSQVDMNFFRTYEAWSLERMSRHVIYWVLWGMFYVVVNSFNEDHSFWQWLIFEFMVLPIKITCTMIVAYVLMPKYLYTGRILEFFLKSMLCFILFGTLLFVVYRYLVYPYVLGVQINDYFLIKFVYKVVELIHIASLFACFKFFQHIVEQRKRNEELKLAAQESQLKYLRNQLQPHFMFNTLNNLYGMVLSGDKGSADMVLRLSEVMSYMLYETDRKYVPLKDEIKNLKNYLELERIRYDRKLKLTQDFDETVNDILIAPLILIPFVENAFKHGPAQEEGTSSIDIRLHTDKESIIFSMENTYSGGHTSDSVRSGIGLENVRTRLDLLYPGSHTLTIHPGPPFAVRLKLSHIDA